MLTFGGWAGGPPYCNFDDPMEKERDPPKRPLEVQFPAYHPAAKCTPLNENKHSYLKKTLTAIRRPEDVTPDLIEQFNIKYQSDASFEDLVPSKSDGVIYQTQLEAILGEEFLRDNVDCFRKVCRLQPLDPSKPLPKLQQSHLFFKGLEDMSRYWDSSQDNYYETVDSVTTVKDTENTEESTSNFLSTPGSTNAETVIIEDVPILSSSSPIASNPISNPHNRTKILEDACTLPKNRKTKSVYRGRRLGNATEMPEDLRESTIEGFLRTITWKFNSAVKRPNIQPRLFIGNVMFPVRHNHIVGRVPKDRILGRAGHLEGPVLASSCRGELRFRKEGTEGVGAGEVVDFMRELGGLLLLAQQRAREGQTENKPGEGAWWTTAKRWGGGPGGKMPHEVAEDVSHTMDTKGKEEALGHIGKEIGVKFSSPTDTAMTDHPNTQMEVVIPAKKDKDKDQDKENTPSPVFVGNKPNSPNPNAVPFDLAKATYTRQVPSLDVPSTGRNGTSISNLRFPRKRTSSNSNPNSSQTRRAPPRMGAFAQRWKEMISPLGLWDPKMAYQAIGREDSGGAGAEWDEVFLLSSVNSHVCLLKMRVSKGYVRWLEKGGNMAGEGEETDCEGERWEREVLYLQRSRWFDLFVPEERGEALRGVWGVVGWILRERVGG